MSGSFAGSGSVDDRRRRRLATRTDQPKSVSESVAASEAELHELADDDSFDPASILLRDLIPADLWKAAVMVAAVVLVAAGALIAGHDPQLRAGQFGAAANHVFGLVPGRAVRFLTLATLLSAAHLALVIATVRSRSPRDFRGRYRVWYWAATLFVGAAMLIATDLHLAFSELIHQSSGVTYHGWVRLNWLIPLAVVTTAITWKLWVDMSLCRSSQICLTLSAVSALALLASDQIVQATGYQHVVLMAQLAVGVSLFAAMLLHVRFVSHVNPNPPEPRPPRTERTPNSREKHAAFSDPEESATTPRATEVRPQRKPKQSRKRTGAVLRDPDEYEEFEEQTPARRRRSRIRRDGPAPESLKGLSKKQRKLARKQFRDQQRATEDV